MDVEKVYEAQSAMIIHENGLLADRGDNRSPRRELGGEILGAARLGKVKSHGMYGVLVDVNRAGRVRGDVESEAVFPVTEPVGISGGAFVFEGDFALGCGRGPHGRVSVPVDGLQPNPSFAEDSDRRGVVAVGGEPLDPPPQLFYLLTAGEGPLPGIGVEGEPLRLGVTNPCRKRRARVVLEHDRQPCARLLGVYTLDPSVLDTDTAVGKVVGPFNVVLVHDQEDVTTADRTLHEAVQAVPVVNIGVDEDVVPDGLEICGQ